MGTHVFAGLVTDDQVGRVTNAFIETIAKSFEFDDANSLIKIHRQTKAEQKRRFEICAEGFQIMKGDLKWSYQRALDELPRYLRAKLDGNDWKPDTRSTWVPG